MSDDGRCIVLLTKVGPLCFSFRCKITVSLAQGAVHDAEADVADPGFVRSTIDALFKHSDQHVNRVGKSGTGACSGGTALI